MKKIIFIMLLLISTLQVVAQESEKEYTLVTYNIENLFDADGEAVFNDYKPTDRNGNPQYTNAHILTKIKNAIQVLKEYNDGKGPDIIAMVEMESDFTPAKEPEDSKEFLDRFSSTTLEKMLGEEFNSDVADLPSELLLLKGMVDSGMWEYKVEIGDRQKGVKPESVQKAVTYSRFQINKEKTVLHTLVKARPILETWIDVKGHELVVLNNHWKSGASSWDMEKIRLENAAVLRHRLNELMAANKDIDVVLAGDFNSDYNQKARYNFEKTAINGVLRSTGDEELIATKKSSQVYNLWYEWPVDQRGSDSYRGQWGTLMQIMIAPGLYDLEGIQYVDNSFSVGDFGFNTHSTSGEPKRWSSAFSGSGYSDHLPVSMKFRLAEYPNEYGNFSVKDDDIWKPIDVTYREPSEYLKEEDFLKVNPTTQPDFYDEYVFLTAAVTDDFKFVVNEMTYDVYAPAFDLDELFSEVAGTTDAIQFYGRFSQFRGNWQFVIESPDFISLKE